MLLCGILSLSAQPYSVFKGIVMDIQNAQPLGNVCVHNISTGMATFSNKSGHFALYVKSYDTLVITHVGYAMENLILSDSMLRSEGRCTIGLTMKSVMLKEFVFYALKPYPIFLEDVSKDAVAMEAPITLTEMEKADATASLSPAMLTVHPFTYLYETFSRSAKMNRLYAYLSNHEEEVSNLNTKFNAEMVSKITGYEGVELEDFLNYCSFSYYTLIQSSEAEIMEMVLKKKEEYQKEYGRQ